MVSNINPLYMISGSATTTPQSTMGSVPLSLLPPAPYFPVPAVTYPSAPGAMRVGKFPNPKSVLRLGNNKEAQQFLSRGGQVIIRMRGLPYDCSAKQVVSR